MLVYPVAATSLREPIGLLLAFVLRAELGGGTVYMKWTRIKGDLLAITFWQIVVGVVVFGRRLPDLRGPADVRAAAAGAPGSASLFNGMFGTGIAYFIWFNIIGRSRPRPPRSAR